MLIPALWRLNQENLKLEASLGYIARLYLKQSKRKKKKGGKEEGEAL